ncbi:MAG: hypothetical protein QXS37_05595, partial [Candidatus Aenigmatarchaeota archaeon]
MKRIIISSVGEKILFSTNINSVYDLMTSIYPARIIPDYEVLEFCKDDTSEVNGYIEYLYGEPKELVKFPKIRTYVKDYSLAETSFLTLQLLERLWEEKNLYCVEASAVSKNNKGILIIGRERSGKTRLALELYKEGFDFISNENTVISPLNNTILGGSKVINIKPFYFDEIGEEFKKLAIEQKTNDRNYRTYLIDLRKRERTKTTSKISLIIEPFIYPYKVSSGLVSEIQEFYVKNNLINLPIFLMRGAYICLNKFNYFGKSIDTEKLARKRCEMFFHKIDATIPK